MEERVLTSADTAARRPLPNVGGRAVSSETAPVVVRTVDTAAVPRPVRTSRLILVSLDGGSYDLLVPRCASGLMPNLDQLFRTSALARLQRTAPSCDSAVWTTLHCGAGIEVHGRLDDRLLDGRRLRLADNWRATPACPTLCELIAAGDREAVGVHLGGFGPALEVWPRRPTRFEEMSAGLATIEARLQNTLSEALRIDAAGVWRVLSLRLDGLADLQRRLGHVIGLGGTGHGGRAWSARLQQTFSLLDRCLGELMELADRRGAGLLVVSPYGFVPLQGKINVVEVLRRRGLVQPASGSVRVGLYAWRLALKARRWLQHAIAGRSGTGREDLALACALPVDWRTSRALAFHGRMGAMVYFNTPQRFGNRAVCSRRQRDQAAGEVLAAFREARHPVTDARLFAEVFQPAERFGGDPCGGLGADVVAIPASGYQLRYRWDRRRHLVQSDPAMAATPGSEGLLVVHAPGVELGHHHRARLVDVAPTAMDLLGFAPAATMTGRPLREIYVAQPRPAAQPGPHVTSGHD